MRYLLGCLLLLYLTGCLGKAGPKDWDDMQQFLTELHKAAKDTGASYSAEITWDGDLGFYAKQQFGVKTGLTMVGHVQGNALTQTAMEKAAAPGGG